MGFFSILKLNDNGSNVRRNIGEQQKRRRVLVMIGIVTLLFSMSWLPIHSIYFSLKFKKEFPVCSKLLYAVKSLAHTFTYLNSMLNPFFYTIVGNNFRKQVFEQKAKYSSRLKSMYMWRSSNNSDRRDQRLNSANNVNSYELSRLVINNSNSMNNIKSCARASNPVRNSLTVPNAKPKGTASLINSRRSTQFRYSVDNLD